MAEGSKAVSLVSETVPAHVKDAKGLGNENVGSEHLQTPRVKLLQQMNDEVDEHSEAYIEGAKPGDLLNTLTDHIYGKEIYVINVHFGEYWVVWRRRDKGGGLVSSCNSLAEAIDAIDQQEGAPDDYETIQTHTHLLLRKDPETGKIEEYPFLMDFAASKLRVSKEWNTQLAQLSGNRFSALWKLTSIKTKNRAGQSFYNLSVKNQGLAIEEDYDRAMQIYGGITK